MVTNLHTLHIFNDPPINYIELLSLLFEPYQCETGTTLVRQGDPAQYLYLILSGHAEVVYNPYEAKPITVMQLEAGDLFGWSAAIRQETYSSSVTAMETLETVRVRSCALKIFCLEHPEAGKDLLERLASSVSIRWENAYEQVSSILAYG